METVVLILMLLVCFNFLLKQTCCKWRSVCAIAAVSALSVGLAWPYAIEQSKTRIADWLADPALMLDTSVILTIDVMLQMAFCLLAARVQTSGPIRCRVICTYRMLRRFPGILIFPVLFSGQVALIFAFPGASFSQIAWCMAGAVLLLIPAGSYLLGKLLPEKELRLELLFLCNALIAILGIIATVNGRTAVKGAGEVNRGALAGLAVLVLAGALLGWLTWRVRQKKQLRSVPWLRPPCRPMI